MTDFISDTVHGILVKDIEDALNTSDAFIQEIISLLATELQVISKEHSLPLQKLDDMKAGMVNTGALFLPLKDFEHLILVKGFPAIFVSTTSTLFKNIYASREDIFIEFAFRTLLELCIERSAILFDPNVPKEEKDRYVALYLLVDYASMSYNSLKYQRHLKRLLQENDRKFNERQKTLFEKIIIVSGNGKDINTHYRLTKRARYLLGAEGTRIIDKYKLDLSKYTHKPVGALKSSYSHILHGNAFLMSQLFSEEGKFYQHKFRTRAFLLMSGVSLVQHISAFLGNPEIEKQCSTLMLAYDEIRVKLEGVWRTFDGNRPPKKEPWKPQ